MTSVDKTLPISHRMVLSVMGRYKPENVRWAYEHGLVLQSIFILGEKTGNENWMLWVRDMYDTKVKNNGVIETYNEGEFNLDLINPGKTLFLLYKKFGDEKYRKAIESLMNQLRRHPRTKTGGLWHKNIYPWQMWLDGLYMAGPFHAQYAALFAVNSDKNAGSVNGVNNVNDDLDDVVHQFVLMESRARDSETGLLYHAWDESRKQLWANPNTGCSPHFWARAIGWYCMALVDTFEFVTGKQRESLEAIACRLVAPLLKYQDKVSGLWHQIPDLGSRRNNYTETSASAMFVYFFLKMIRLGVVTKIDSPVVREAALTAYNGLLREKLREEQDGQLHLNGICKVAGLGGSPYRDGSWDYYMSEPVVEDDFKGIGPFIFASMEVEGLL